MHSLCASSAAVMTTGMPAHDTSAKLPAEADGALSREIDRPLPASPAEVPKKTLQDRMRLPLLLLFPLLLAILAGPTTWPRSRTFRPTMLSSMRRRSP